jgi:antitoxin HicB
LERDEGGRYLVHFPDLPEALTDGVDKKEALVEAADCLSEALASRIVDGEEIPSPSSLNRGQYLISPDPIIALKAALYTALEAHGMTIAHLADRLGMKDWHQAARLIDPKQPSKLRRLTAALDALGWKVEIAVVSPEIADRATVRLGNAWIAATFPPRYGSRCTSRTTFMGEVPFRNDWFPPLPRVSRPIRIHYRRTVAAPRPPGFVRLRECD